MKIRVTYFQVSARVGEVLQAILSSEEWARDASALPSSDYMDGRKTFLRLFDVYEGRDGEEWLGIMEWAVLEEMRTSGAALVANESTVNRIVDRFERHPDIDLER